MSGWVDALFVRAAAICAGVALAAVAVACATPYERAFGRSFSDHRAATIANPEAGANWLEAPLPDGQSTDAALTKHRTQEKKVDQGEPPSVVNVNVGG